MALQGEDKTGTVVIADSGNIPQVVVDTAQGLNGTIAFTFLSYSRILSVECRSAEARNDLLEGIKDDDGELEVDSTTYLVKSISFREHFISKDSDYDVWTYDIELYRDDYSV